MMMTRSPTPACVQISTFYVTADRLPRFGPLIQNERLESRLRAKRDSLPPYILSAAPARFLTGRYARMKSVIGATCYTSCPAASMNGCRASCRKVCRAPTLSSPALVRL